MPTTKEKSQMYAKVRANHFVCLICAKISTQPGNVKAHVKRHAGERPFKCEFCPKTFAKDVSLKCHNLTCTEVNTELAQITEVNSRYGLKFKLLICHFLNRQFPATDIS